MPAEVSLPSFRDIFATQEATSHKMAEHLESLVHHYQNMSQMMHDFEAGEEFSDADMQGAFGVYTPRCTIDPSTEMNQDTEALPVIIGHLEDGAKSIETQQCVLLSASSRRLAERQRP